MLDKLRTLASDTIVYGTSTVVQRFLTFMLTPLYTNFLTMTELGNVANLYSLIAFVNVLYAFGFESAFLRFYRKEDPNRSSIYSTSFLAIAVLSAFMSLLGLSFSSTLSSYSGLSGDQASSIIIMAALIPFFDALTIIPFARLRMERRARTFASLKLLIVAVNIIANIVLVVVLHYGAIGVFIAGCSSSLLSFIVFIPSLIRSVKIQWNKSMFYQLLQFGLPTLPSGFSSIMLQVADRPILKAMTDPATVGLYNANYRLGIPIMLFSSVFEYAWKPFYLLHADDADAKPMFARVFTYFCLVSATLFLVLSFFIGDVVQMPFIGGRFFHESYWTGLGIVPIVAAAYFFTGVSTNFAAGLHITKQTSYLPIAIGAAAIANLVLNLSLIPLMSYYGAAWATFGAYIVSAVVMYYYSQRAFKIDYEWRRVGLIIGICIVVFLLSQLFFVQVDSSQILFRIALLGLFVGLLWMLKFFSRSEIHSIRKMFFGSRRS